MTAPTPKVRALTYARDGNRCVSCGSPARLTWQHRQATGMGGRGSKAPVLTAADGLTACAECNTAFEASMQSLALLNGWKVRKWSPVEARHVPVFYRIEHAWYLLNTDGSRDRINDTNAAELMGMAGVTPIREEGTNGVTELGSR